MYVAEAHLVGGAVVPHLHGGRELGVCKGRAPSPRDGAGGLGGRIHAPRSDEGGRGRHDGQPHVAVDAAAVVPPAVGVGAISL